MILAVVALAGVGLVWKLQTQKRARTAKAEAVIRTVPATVGDLRKSVRIAGVIQAERFAAIMAPRMRGSRSGRGRQSSMVGNANASTTTASTSSTSSSSSSSTSSSSSASSASTSLLGSSAATTSITGSSDSSATATPGAAPAQTSSSLGALRTSTTSRFSDTGRAVAQQASNAIGSRAASSAAIPAANLGSTSGNLMGSITTSGGSGGGMAGDFSLILVRLAKPGSQVKKGDVVAEFDRQYQLLRLDDYKSSLDQLDGNIKQMKADQAVAKEAHDQLVKSAKADYEKALWDVKTIEVRSAIESENFKLNVEETRAKYKQAQDDAKLLEVSQKAELRAAEVDRDQARIEYERAKVNVDTMLMKAPLDGIVVMQTIWRGGDFGQVQQGDEVHPGRMFMNIVDPTSMVMNATINQADSELLRLGMKANVRLDAYPEVTLPATVIGVGAMTKPGGWRPSYVREIPVRLRLDRIDPRVLPDLTASAAIVLAAEENAVQAPLESIFYSQDTHQPFVYLQGPTGWLRREVKLGLTNHVAAVVRSGLQKGDVLAAERPPQEKP